MGSRINEVLDFVHRPEFQRIIEHNVLATSKVINSDNKRKFSDDGKISSDNKGENSDNKGQTVITNKNSGNKEIYSDYKRDGKSKK
jgi:hypothetical protein